MASIFPGRKSMTSCLFGAVNISVSKIFLWQPRGEHRRKKLLLFSCCPHSHFLGVRAYLFRIQMYTGMYSLVDWTTTGLWTFFLERVIVGLNGSQSVSQLANPPLCSLGIISNTLLCLQREAWHNCPLRGYTQQPMEGSVETHSETLDGAWGLLLKSWEKD